MSDNNKSFVLAQTLAKAMTDIYNAKTRLEVLSNEIYVAGSTKHTIRVMISGLKNTLSQFTDRLQVDQLKEIRESMLNDEQTIQLESITSMMVSLPPAIRDQLEKHIESYYKVYAQKVPA